MCFRVILSWLHLYSVIFAPDPVVRVSRETIGSEGPDPRPVHHPVKLALEPSRHFPIATMVYLFILIFFRKEERRVKFIMDSSHVNNLHRMVTGDMVKMAKTYTVIIYIYIHIKKTIQECMVIRQTAKVVKDVNKVLGVKDDINHGK